MTMKMKMGSSLVGWVIILFILFSCSYQVAQLPLNTLQDEDTPQAYLIGPEDVLEVLVWKNQTLSKVVTVRPDGKISLPLIGDVQATGLTAVQLKEDIGKKLEPYFKESPDISVIVQQVNSYVYILGEVQRPNKYVVRSGTTVIQGIALAGGFTQFASTNNILLIRRGNGNNDGANEKSEVKIRYRDIVSGKGLETNLVLKTGDTIIIP